jgi:hypothetical protein
VKVRYDFRQMEALRVRVLSGAVHKITSNECTQTHPLLLIKGVSPLKSCIPYWPNQKVTPWAWNSIMCTMYSAHNQFCTPGRISNVFRHCSQLSVLFRSRAVGKCVSDREREVWRPSLIHGCAQNQASSTSHSKIMHKTAGHDKKLKYFKHAKQN